MKLITLLFTALILTGCTSDNGTTLQNENAFISGNGISLFLEKEDRKMIMEQHFKMKMHSSLVMEFHSF